MSDLIAKIFIKDYKNVTNEKVRNKYGFIAGIVGIITNLILVTIKMLLGLAANSVSIIADAINNLGDAASSIVTLVGFKLSGKAADEDHPFGHERIEYISGLIISLLIFLVGINFIIESIKKIINPIESNFNYVTLIALVISILLKVWQSIFYHKFSKKINSTTLDANSKDALNDCLSTSAVLISAIIMLIWPNLKLDGYFGLVVSLFIIKTGFELIKETSDPLIGSLPPQSVVDDVFKICLSNKKILGYHDFIVHSYGPNKMFASIHLEFDYREDILEIHDIVDNIEFETTKKTGIQLVVHMDPVDSKNPETLQLKEQVKKIIDETNGVSSFHDFRVVVGPTHTNVLFDIVVDQWIANKVENKSYIREQITKAIKDIDNKYEVIISIDTNFVYKNE